MKKFNTKKLPSYFNSSADINWKDRIDMQAVLQNHVDTAISSTINLPNKCSLSEIEQLYLYAWEKGLKGVTIYRAGCAREGILINKDIISNNQKNNKKEVTILKRGDIVMVDDNVIGLKRKIQTGCGSLHIQGFFDP